MTVYDFCLAWVCICMCMSGEGFHQFIMMHIVCAVNSPKLFWKRTKAKRKCYHIHLTRHIFGMESQNTDTHHTVHYTRKPWSYRSNFIISHPNKMKHANWRNWNSFALARSLWLFACATNENFMRMTNCLVRKTMENYVRIWNYAK